MINAIIIFGGYFGVLAVLSLFARPYRARLLVLGAELGAEYQEPDDQRFILALMSSAYSWRAAIVQTLVYLTGIFRRGDELDRACEEYVTEKPEFARDPRVHEMLSAYFASAVAVNPLFGILAITAKTGFRIKARLHHRGKQVDHLSDYVGYRLTV